jgi:outer membrane protein assembly factor BamB
MIKKLITISLIVLLQACGDDDNAEPPAELIDFQVEAIVDELWSASPNKGISHHYLYLEPLVFDKQMVTAGREGLVSVIDLQQGDVIARLELNKTLSAGVGGNSDTWFVATREGELIAIDAASRKVKWTRSVPSEILSAPVIAGDAVIVRTIDGHVQSYAAADGNLNWSYSKVLPALTLRGVSKPVITRDHVFIGQENGHLIALSLDKGELAWDVTLSVPSGRSEIQRLVDIDGNAELYGHVLYAVGFQGRMAAIDVNTGQFLWARSFSSETGVSVDEEAVYATDQRGHIWAIDRFNGATLWKQDQLTAREVTRPVIAGDYLLVGDYAGVLHVLSRLDGHFVAREDIGSESDGILLPPVVNADRAIVTLRNGDVYAFTINSLLAESKAATP